MNRPQARAKLSEFLVGSIEQARAVESALEDMRWLQDRWRSLPIIDPRPLDEIVEYDENGLPV